MYPLYVRMHVFYHIVVFQCIHHRLFHLGSFIKLYIHVLEMCLFMCIVQLFVCFA